MNEHVTALFHDVDDAGRAVEALLAAGVARGEISLVTTEERASYFGIVERSKASEGALAGGLIGGTLGAIGASLIAAASAGAGIFAAGPILIGLAGLGAGGSFGGLAGALIGLGLPEHEAKYYEHEIRRRDAILIGVASLRHDARRIGDILSRHSGANVAENV